MLPLELYAVRPLVEQNKRLVSLMSGYKFGSTEIHDEHIAEKLNSFVESFYNSDPHDTYERVRTVPMPQLGSIKTDDINRPSDLLLGETCRQYHGINERFRRTTCPLPELRKLVDPATRWHISVSRGLERSLVDFFNRLDAEFLDRSTLKPRPN